MCSGSVALLKVVKDITELKYGVSPCNMGTFLVGGASQFKPSLRCKFKIGVKKV